MRHEKNVLFRAHIKRLVIYSFAVMCPDGSDHRRVHVYFVVYASVYGYE